MRIQLIPVRNVCGWSSFSSSRAPETINTMSAGSAKRARLACGVSTPIAAGRMPTKTKTIQIQTGVLSREVVFLVGKKACNALCQNFSRGFTHFSTGRTSPKVSPKIKSSACDHNITPRVPVLCLSVSVAP